MTKDQVNELRAIAMARLVTNRQKCPTSSCTMVYLHFDRLSNREFTCLACGAKLQVLDGKVVPANQSGF
jgi:transcription initiation factor IIE alpha subunit